MEEVRIEVVSSEEGIELCNVMGWVFDHVYIGRSANYGKLMMLAYTNNVNKRDNSFEDSDIPNPSQQKSKQTPDKSNSSRTNQNKAKQDKAKQDKAKQDKATYVIYASTSTGPLFWVGKSKQKVCYNVNEAQRFGYRAAKTKTIMMNKVGSYTWRLRKITDSKTPNNK